MTDKEKKGINPDEEIIEEHDHCDCEGEDCNCNTITLEMEDGSKKDFMVLDYLEHEGKQYIALAEVDSLEYDIMAWEAEDEHVNLTVIEDDAEFNLVAAKFEVLFQSDDEEPED